MAAAVSSSQFIPSQYYRKVAEKKTLRLVPFNNKMEEAAERLDLLACQRLLQEIRECRLQPNVFTYTAMIKPYVRLDNEEAALEVIRQMVAEKIKLNAVPFTILLSLYVKRSDEKGALGVWDLMKEHGVIPDKAFYNVLLNLLGRVGDVVFAKKVFKEAEVLDLESHIRDNTLDLHKYSTGTSYIAVLIFIDSHWNPKKKCHIITGVHPEKRDLIRTRLPQEYPHIRCRPVPHNAGRLEIS